MRGECRHKATGLRGLVTSRIHSCDSRGALSEVTVAILEEPSEEQARTLGLTIHHRAEHVYCCEIGHAQAFGGNCPFHGKPDAWIQMPPECEPLSMPLAQFENDWEMTDERSDN